MNNKFKGTGVAIVTPFNEDKNIDFSSFGKIIEYQIAGGVNYLVFLGTTGEAVVLDGNEKNEIISFAKKIVNNRVPIVIGIGGNNTKQVTDTIEKTDLEGIDAILSVSPYYNKPQQRGIYEHYKAIAETSPVPVIIYNVPGRTGSNISAETTLKIAHDLPNVIATKEASGNFEQISTIIKNRPEDFLVISGDDPLTLPLLAIGGDGVISVTANVFPKQFSDMVNFGLSGDFDKAKNIHLQLTDVMKALFADGSPSGAKAALTEMGLCKNIVRPPLVNVSDKVNEMISKIIKDIK